MIKRIKNKNVKAILFSFVIMQIFLLVNSITAESYMINKNSPTENNVGIGKSDGKTFKKYFNLLVGFLAIKQIGTVSAATPDIFCCEKTIDNPIYGNGNTLGNMWCSETDDSNNCNSNYQLTRAFCADTSFCIAGTCIVNEGEICTDNAVKTLCESPELGGRWDSRNSNEIQECLRGACVIKDSAIFATEKSCRIKSQAEGVDFDWRAEVDTELETSFLSIALSSGENYGACVLDNGDCRFVTGNECGDRNSFQQFFPRYLCTHPELKDFGVTYEPTNEVDCRDNHDEIYFKDSGGNYANIYDENQEFDGEFNSYSQIGDEDYYWAYFVPKSQSCGFNDADGNANSKTCGNCASSLSSSCSATSGIETHVNDGDFVCKDLSCEYDLNRDGTKDKFKNGESWCVYDGAIGDVDGISADTAGSEHVLMSCNRGIIEPEICGSRRSEVCVPKVIEETVGDKTFRMKTASCQTNLAGSCISYNPLMTKVGDDMQDNVENINKCNQNPHCVLRNIDIDEEFKFKICVPKYTTGTSDYCSLASVKCPVVYERDYRGEWDDITNENCEEPVFAQTMSDLCVSLGDCGSDVNYAGVGTDNVQIIPHDNDDVPVIFRWRNYANYATFHSGQAAVSGVTIAGSGGNVNIDSLGEIEYGVGDEIGNNVLNLRNAFGVVGVPVYLINGLVEGGTWALTAGGTPSTLVVTQIIEGEEVIGTSTTFTPGVSGSLTAGGFVAVAAGAFVGAALGNWIATKMGVGGDGALLLTIAGAVYGATVAYALLQEAGASALYGGGYGLAIFIGVYILVESLGIGDQETRDIEFTCGAWEAPIGGQNCGKCNEDPLIPCTSYRCGSLGQGCTLIQGDSTNKICTYDNPNDATPPVLTLGEFDATIYIVTGNETIGGNNTFGTDKTIQVGEVASNLNPKGVQELETVTIQLLTDEFAQCKFSTNIDEMTGTFDQMDVQTVDGTGWRREHMFNFDTPSIESLNLPEDETSGDINIYIICQDYYSQQNRDYGNFNSDPYVIKMRVESRPDITPPAIKSIEPSKNSYIIYGETSREINVWLSERGSCRYNPSAGIPYNQMPDVPGYECSVNSGSRRTAKGYLCEGINITGITTPEFKSYIKCQDDEPSPNQNVQDYEYVLKKTPNALQITTMTLSSVISSQKTATINSGEELKVGGGTSTPTITLRATTSGGANVGKAKCSYKWPENSNFVEFRSDALLPQTSHWQQLNLPAGSYEIKLSCTDTIPGNVQTGTATFTLSVDSTSPKVVRASKEGGMLKLITDEEAKCYYSVDTEEKCGFDLSDTNVSKLITTGLFSKQHSTSWNGGQTYYIKCVDYYDNGKDGCAKIIIPTPDVNF